MLPGTTIKLNGRGNKLKIKKVFRELIEKDIRNRGQIVPVGKISPEPAKYLRYCSMFMFGQDMVTFAKTQNSVKDFKGKVYTEAVWIDVDYDKDVNQARLSAIQVVKRLNGENGINPDHLFIYFSGKKGFHIAVFNKLIGFDNSTPIEPAKVKDFVQRLTAGISHIDFIIYEPVRIFRIANSRHEKSGLYKIRISFDELQCDLDSILALAKEPRQYPYKTNINEFTLKESLNNLWINSGNYAEEQKEFESKGNLFQPPTEGSRNKTLLTQACVLFRKSELSSNAIFDIVSNAAYIANISAKEQVDNVELKRIICNAERLVGDERKKSLQETIQIKSFGEWVPEWENFILQEHSNMSLGFMDLNYLMKGRLKGKLGVVMGYGGAKKSLYGLNVCLKNMSISEEVSIYSTMEMSVPQLINRIIDHEVYVEGQSLNAHEIAARNYRENVKDGKDFLLKLSKAIGNKLQITQNGRMTYEGYKTCIEKVKETAGTPAILVVDGLSMMGGKGTETEVYSRNSADLKELANEQNILVLLICHVSKGAELFTRDLSRFLRGSEKILDNCDFYMTMSQIQEKDNPEQYRKDIGFINFHDKRGSGEIINLVYWFEPRRLRLIDSTYNSVDFYSPVKEKNNGKISTEEFFRK